MHIHTYIYISNLNMPTHSLIHTHLSIYTHKQTPTRAVSTIPLHTPAQTPPPPLPPPPPPPLLRLIPRSTILSLDKMEGVSGYDAFVSGVWHFIMMFFASAAIGVVFGLVSALISFTCGTGNHVIVILTLTPVRSAH